MKTLLYIAAGLGIAYLIWPTQVAGLFGGLSSAVPAGKTSTGAAPLSNPSSPTVIGRLSITGSKFGTSLVGQQNSVAP